MRLGFCSPLTELVVLLRGDGTVADRHRTIDALKTNTADLEIRLCDASEADRCVALETAGQSGRQVILIGSESASSAVADHLAWDVVQRAQGADVVLLEIGAAVGPSWHEQLRHAAYGDAGIATASAVPDTMLTLHDEVGERLEFEAGEFAHGPALGRPVWGCVYVRRDALNVATNARWSDRNRKAGSPLRLEELVLVPGLVHVLATSVVLLAADRPETSVTPAVRRALAAVEAAVGPLRVTVDLRCCSFPLSGTQVHAVSLVSSLSARDDLRLSILLPTRVHQSVRPYLDGLPPTVTRYTTGQSMVPRPQVFHRPYQLLYDDELSDVVAAGVRFVLTHQDLILDRAPAYFRSEAEWHAYTSTTALSLMAADEVVFFSEHARQEALRDGLVDQAKTSVVPPGTDHLDDVGEAVMPSAVSGLLASGRRPFLLVIGNAYIHKNRVFALRLAEELSRGYAWEGAVVFAGGKPGSGASVNDERAFLHDHEGLRSRFVDLGPVTDAERRWLYRHAALVLFPTLYEGFGLIPFEAAAAGTACAYSGRSSVAEYLPPEGALLDLGDMTETARQINRVLESSDACESIVGAIRLSGTLLTWARAAESYVSIYRRSMTRPVGLALLSERGVVAGAISQMASSEAERRLAMLFRRSAAVRLIVRAVFASAIAGRRFARRR